jgi:hypothetical protein
VVAAEITAAVPARLHATIQANHTTPPYLLLRRSLSLALAATFAWALMSDDSILIFFLRFLWYDLHLH